MGFNVLLDTLHRQDTLHTKADKKSDFSCNQLTDMRIRFQKLLKQVLYEKSQEMPKVPKLCDTKLNHCHVVRVKTHKHDLQNSLLTSLLPCNQPATM